MIQFPTAFEFNLSYLNFIGDHFNSGLFGNFLSNTERNRIIALNVKEQTRSIWSHVLDYKSNFVNKFYEYHERPIWPSCAISKMQVWHRYYSRWNYEMHPNRLAGEEWHDDWLVYFIVFLFFFSI